MAIGGKLEEKIREAIDHVPFNRVKCDEILFKVLEIFAENNIGEVEFQYMMAMVRSIFEEAGRGDDDG